MSRSPLACLLGATLTACGAAGMFWASDRLIQIAPARRTFEFCQYAEIGRNLATRGEYRTRLVEPMAMCYIDAHRQTPDTGSWPVVNRYPWCSFVTAVLMSVFGPTETVAAWSNGIAIILLLTLSFIWTYKTFGAATAFTAAIVCLMNPSFFGYFILLGTPDVWFAVLFLTQLFVFVTLLSQPAPPWSTASAWGLLSGMTYLCRANLSLALAVQIAALLLRKQRRSLGWGLSVFLVVICPLVLYNLLELGVPLAGIYSQWNLLDGVGWRPIEPWQYYELPSVSAVVRDHWRDMLAKWGRNLTHVVVWRVWTLWHLHLLLPIALLTGWRHHNGALLRWCYWLFWGQVLIFAGLRLEFEERLSPHHGRYFFWFALPAAVIGIQQISSWVQPPTRRFVLAGLIIGQCLICLPTWKEWRQQNRAPNQLAVWNQLVRLQADLIAPDRVVAATAPAVLTWRENLRTVSLPADPEQLELIRARSQTPIDYLAIDSYHVFIDIDSRWRALLSQSVPGGSKWRTQILRDYEPIITPNLVENFSLLRHRTVPPTAAEIQFRDRWRQAK